MAISKSGEAGDVIKAPYYGVLVSDSRASYLYCTGVDSQYPISMKVDDALFTALFTPGGFYMECAPLSGQKAYPITIEATGDDGSTYSYRFQTDNQRNTTGYKSVSTKTSLNNADVNYAQLLEMLRNNNQLSLHILVEKKNTKGQLYNEEIWTNLDTETFDQEYLKVSVSGTDLSKLFSTF